MFITLTAVHHTTGETIEIDVNPQAIQSMNPIMQPQPSADNLFLEPPFVHGKTLIIWVHDTDPLFVQEERATIRDMIAMMPRH